MSPIEIIAWTLYSNDPKHAAGGFSIVNRRTGAHLVVGPGCPMNAAIYDARQMGKVLDAPVFINGEPDDSTGYEWENEFRHECKVDPLWIDEELVAPKEDLHKELLERVYEHNAQGNIKCDDKAYAIITEIAEVLYSPENMPIPSNPAPCPMPNQEPLRWKLRSDGDGHDYCIPVELEKEFDEWREWSDEYWGHGRDCSKELPDWTGADFDRYRIEGGEFTFTQPKYQGKVWEPNL